MLFVLFPKAAVTGVVATVCCSVLDIRGVAERVDGKVFEMILLVNLSTGRTRGGGSAEVERDECTCLSSATFFETSEVHFVGAALEGGFVLKEVE